jgi:hypothetical protein
MMRNSIPFSNHARAIASLVSQTARNSDNPKLIYSAFHGDTNIADTLKEILDRDSEYGPLTEDNGLLLAHPNESASVVIKHFAEICIGEWDINHRPSLPAIAVKELDRFGASSPDDEVLSKEEQRIAKAMVLIAARAEMIKGKPPTDNQKAKVNSYHNSVHTAHVAELASFLTQKNNQMFDEGTSPIKLQRKDQLLVSLAAFAHDIDHSGGANPPDDKYLMEEKSFQAVLPLMQEMKISESDISTVHLLLRTTSPNGPTQFLKKIIKSGETEETSMKTLDPENNFPELEPLIHDIKLLQMAAILSDSDLFASAGAGLDANIEMSTRISDELNKAAGVDRFDFTQDKSRKFFMDNIVGAGFISYAGAEAGNDNFIEMYQKTERNILYQSQNTLICHL